MTRRDLRKMWAGILRKESPTRQDFNQLAGTAVELYNRGDDLGFNRHIANRFRRVTERTGHVFDEKQFDPAAARAFIADELGFSGWETLVEEIDNQSSYRKPLIYYFAAAAMDMGNFTAFEQTVGPENLDETVRDWFEKGYLDEDAVTRDELFAAACMLGYPKTAEFLLDQGVDPYAGMRTGLAGFHYAASSGRIEVIKALITRKVPMEVKNMYGGTVFGQAIWSAVNEYTPDHAEIVEELVKAGAVVDDGYPEWWDKQPVADTETKRRIAAVLRNHDEFHSRVDSAEQQVAEAEASGSKRLIADSLKALGNLLRRPPFTRDAANEAYHRAAAIYEELGLPLEEAWVKRHIGINHEYAGRLEEAEKYYDEALALYREHSAEDDLNDGNAVRYPAVIKERLGKKEESARLWEEAHDRYARVHPDGLGEGVAEAAAWLTILAIEKHDLDLASKWFARASDASSKSSDPDTHKFINETGERLEKAKNS